MSDNRVVLSPLDAEVLRARVGETGAFVVLTGIDGCGKSEQAVRLRAALESVGLRVVPTCEPTRGVVGSEIRRRLTARGAQLDPLEMAHLFAADRAAHSTEIRRWMSEGSVVVTDRYDESSVAYQGTLLAMAGMEGAREWVAGLSARFVRPAAYVVIQVPVEVAQLRAQSRGSSDAYEREAALQEGVAATLGSLGRYLPGARVEHVDGTGAPDEVHARVLDRALAALLGRP